MIKQANLARKQVPIEISAGNNTAQKNAVTENFIFCSVQDLCGGFI